MKINTMVKLLALGIGGLLAASAQTPDRLIDVSSPLFEPSVLHSLDITMSETDWQTLQEKYLENTVYPCAFQWDGTQVEGVSVRSRGSSSRLAAKPSLKIAIDQYTSGRKFMNQKSLILLNMSQDPPMLRDYLSMQMFRRAGMSAPRDAFTRVTVNGKYMGLYLLTEDIDTPFLARQFYNNTGWLYEYKMNFIYNFEDLGSDEANYIPVPFELKTNKKTPNPQALIDLVKALNSATPETFIEVVSPLLDINRFLRHLAVEIYLGEIDGLVGVNGMSNFYLYQPGAGSDPFQVIAWDKSAALNFWDYPIWVRINDNVMLRTAMQVPELKARFLKHLRDMNNLAGGEGGWLEQTALRAIELTKDAAVEDPVKPYSNAEYDEWVQFTLYSIRARYGHLDEQLKAEGH